MWVKLTSTDHTDKETETKAAEALMSNVKYKSRLEPTCPSSLDLPQKILNPQMDRDRYSNVYFLHMSKSEVTQTVGGRRGIQILLCLALQRDTVLSPPLGVASSSPKG